MCELLLPNRIPGTDHYTKHDEQDFMNPFQMSLMAPDSPDYLNISTDSFDRIYFSNPSNTVDNCREYTDQVCSYLQQHENEIYQAPKKISISKEDRAALIDWILWVCYEFNFTDETFFSAITIIDKIFQEISTERSHLQFYGATAIWIASKLNETQTPSVEDFVCLCNYEFKAEEFCQFEKKILTLCHFNIIEPTTDSFTSAFLSQIPSDPNFIECAKMLMYASVYSPDHVNLKPSHDGLAVITVSKQITEYPMNLVVIPRSLQYFEENELNHATLSLLDGLKIAISSRNNSFFMKFADFLQYNTIDYDNIIEKTQRLIATNSLSSSLES